jgi:glycyl-tRNA synthetase beta chain
MMMDTLLVEIGTEEIPAGYIVPALEALAATLQQRLAAARIAHGAVETFGTPRRLTVMVAQVASRQQAITDEVLGPPQRVGMDGAGQLTLAGRKFAEKMGVAAADIHLAETEKGAYLAVTVTDPGMSSLELLAEVLPEVILATPFPKSMRWGELAVSFARPIHSILALLGRSMIPLRVGNIASSRTSFGHRFMAPGRIRIALPQDYLPALRSAKVLADIGERRRRVLKVVKAAARKAGGEVLPDEELVEIVTHLVEWPVPVVGQFDTGYLEIPDEILITAMREHQKYFAVIDPASRRLMARFIAVNNTRGRSMALIARGHERVLRARLEDARFFYRSDLEKSLESRVDALQGVMFQARLGSMLDKTRRIQRLVAGLADAMGASRRMREQTRRAAWLCKADLVSHVVGEFPKLQGVMGRIYAAAGGEPAAVATAIEEHYRPIASGSILPASKVGALLAFADKLDTICGCFGVGLVPTGASDPYALRRQGIGIVQIMLQHRFEIGLRSSIGLAVEGYGTALSEPAAATAERVYEFLRGRIGHLLGEDGIAKDVAAAVIDVSVDHIPHAWARAAALQTMKQHPDFEALAVAFKRVVNILRKSGQELPAATQPDPARFEHASERNLHDALGVVRRKLAALVRKGDFTAALNTIATLRAPVDAFFDAVLVMAKEADLRRNRLALLRSIAELFGSIADFSRIATR